MRGPSGDTTPATLSPTISSIASDLSLEDIAAMPHTHDQAPRMSSDFIVEKHPEHFIENDMVEVQVQRTLFRIPLNNLTDHSPHFASQVRENPANARRLNINDEDVGDDAFAHLVHAMRTPGNGPEEYGYHEVLDRCTSSRFQVGMSDLRNMAIQSIWPLATSIDKIALGGAYDIPEWLPAALEDVHARQDDLTLDEARRLTLEDVVNIGRCRGERARKIANTPVAPRKPRSKIGRFFIFFGLLVLAFAAALLHLDNNLVNQAIHRVSNHSALLALCQPTNSSVAPLPTTYTFNFVGNKTSDKVVVATAVMECQRDRKRITRWLGQLEDKSPKYKSAESSLLSVIQATPSEGPIVVDVLLLRGLAIFNRVYEKNERFQAKPNGRPKYPEIILFEHHVVEPLWHLHNASNHQLLHTPATEAFLTVAGHWKVILNLPVHLDPFQVWNHPQFKLMVFKAVYVSYLIHKFPELADLKIYQTLWTRLTDALSSYKSAKATTGARTIQRFLELTATFVSTNKASIEMDGFYELAEDRREEASRAGQHDLAQILKEILEQRMWPKD